jgi:hypothetical protein
MFQRVSLVGKRLNFIRSFNPEMIGEGEGKERMEGRR